MKKIHSMIPVSTFTDGFSGGLKIESDKTGKFKYASGSSSDYETTYYYDDSYFSNDSYVYNASLSTMSLCLAMSAFGSNEKEYLYKSDNVKDLLEQIGFTNFDTNYWFKVKPTEDSIGVAAAYKKINVVGKPYTLITTAVRGGGYEEEWSSNFTLGRTGLHEGFDEASSDILKFLKDYISENSITGDIKLWITGYSRGAAAANIVSGKIDSGETFQDCLLNPHDMYSYNFEPPMGDITNSTQVNENCQNIFNIVNPSDPVPKVAPGVFGFIRCGIDKVLPSPINSSTYNIDKENMLKMYSQLPSVKDYIVDDFSNKKISISFPLSIVIIDDKENHTTQSAFLDNVIVKISKEEIKSRSNYVDKYQDGIREIFKVLDGTTDSVDGKHDVKWSDFRKIFKDEIFSHLPELIASTNYIGEEIVGSTSDLIEKYAVDSLNKAGITSFDKEQICSFAKTLALMAFEFVVSHPDLTVTLVSNRDEAASAHYPELCLAWLESMDKNYTSDAKQVFSSGFYRIIRVNCPVSVEVYDMSNNQKMFIKQGETQNFLKRGVLSSVNADGEKLIYLPVNADYKLKLTPTASGTMSYSINEYNFSAGDITRIINYNDIPIVSGSAFTSSVPLYEKANVKNEEKFDSGISYSLYSSANELIQPDDDLKGKDASNAYYMVNVSVNNKEYGIAVGQGIRYLGSYAKVTAAANTDCKFEGWYIDGKMVSAKAEYRFCVKSDTDVLAKFERIK